MANDEDILIKVQFRYITGHGVPETQLTSVIEVVNNFFKQPLDQKKKLLSRDRAKRGYSPVETENFASLIGEKKPNDICEKVRFGPTLPGDSDDPYYRSKVARTHFAPNEWGDEAESFRSAIIEYYSALETLTDTLLEIIAIGLGVSVSSFRSKMNKHTSIMSLNYYPPVTVDAVDAIRPLPSSSSMISSGPKDCDARSDIALFLSPSQQFRIAEHTDVSMITIVNQSSSNSTKEESWGGLEIKDSLGQWLPVPYVSGASNYIS